MEKNIKKLMQRPKDHDAARFCSLEALMYLNQQALAEVFGMKNIKESKQ
jgi:hypothetical protein